jgi:hypothetical protein
MNPLAIAGLVALGYFYINRPLTPPFEASGGVAIISLNLASPTLQSLSLKSLNEGVKVVGALDATAGIQLKSDLLDPSHLAKVNELLKKGTVYSKSGTKRTFDHEKKFAFFDRKRGTVQVLIPFKDNAQ